MKKIIVPLCLAVIAAAAARADTALTIPAIYGCLYDFGGPSAIPNPATVYGSFSLPGISGQGILESQIPSIWDEHIPPSNTDERSFTYSYTLDLSGLPAAANHCVKLQIHFGTPAGCYNPGVEGDPGQIQSATVNPWGDITFVFNGGCLQSGQPAVTFSMISAAGFKTNLVTIIDDYSEPASGQTNEVRISVPAIVPDIPPDPPIWEIAYYYSRLHPVLFQGNLANLVGTNQTATNIPINGKYDFALQVAAWPTNGPVISSMTTQTVSVVNGLFTVPLPGDPTAFGDGSVRYLNMGIRPTGGSGGFTPLNPPLPVTPAPQSYYAFSAGSVADLAPGQAVTSLNGLTDAVNLQPGYGISFGTNGNTLVISMQPGVPSDRNIKTDFANLKSDEILNKLAALRIQSWRYTNEVAGIRHVGPMAQDFKALFGLGSDDKIIPFVDEQGVALAAIQELYRKVEADNAALRADNADLKARLEKLEREQSPGAPSGNRP